MSDAKPFLVRASKVEPPKEPSKFGGFPGTEKIQEGCRQEIKRLQGFLGDFLKQEKKPTSYISAGEVAKVMDKVNALSLQLRNLL